MGTKKFELKSKFKPFGDQPEAINKLVDGINNNKKMQTLLGVTGSGKTFTIANVIERTQRPTLVMAHNKTLAAQLYEELKELFPENKVEYFVSYYDYYQPESYIPTTDQYIEKDSAVNPKLDQMRLAATAAVLSRRDTIIVASVSCIYGLGNPENYMGFRFGLDAGQKIKRNEIISRLIGSRYERNDIELQPGRFRVKGDIVDLIPSDINNIIRIEMFGDEIERIIEIDKITGEKIQDWEHFTVYPAKHFMVPEEEIEEALNSIEYQLENDLPQHEMFEAHRLKQRTLHDLEMIKETGYCKGIENYSRHFDKRKAGEKPYCLLDYFPKDFLMVIDESHQTIPQVHGMYKGDRARKANLIEYGFRLDSAYDNRPLKFEEFEEYLKRQNTIFVSATPGDYEKRESKQIVEQIIRPTGLIDPEVEVRPLGTQVIDIKKEIEKAVKKGQRVLLTTLTKKLAEELTEYLGEQKIKTRYLHSEVETLERTEIIRELRLGTFDVLVGINLLREGIDIPEVGLVGILDADKEGFLRNDKSLIQTIGRAARNKDARVIMYADVMTDSIKRAINETKRRRKIQMAYNKAHNIKPKTIVKPIKEKVVELIDTKHIPKSDIPNLIIEAQKEMEDAADKLDFETAIMLRNKVKKLQARLE
ncbi:MAG: excinuclease ABC subunit UvrB [Nanoarchaeota archaeon]|jgi:excinuclease ABC subunit B|nr:excinuclease ABC subunit UvrB [Nanoarchaeota archaeon]